MKKQIVAILAIIAVITTLLTVNALSNEVGYELSLCDAIGISIENATVTDFLNATNKATVQVYNTKRYEVDNIQMVQWSSSDSSLDIYVNVTAGNIVRIEKKNTSTPILYHEKISKYTYDSEACSYTLYDPYVDRDDFAYCLSHITYIDTYAACPADWTITTLREDNYCEFEDTTFDWTTYMRYLMQANSTTSAKYPWFPYP